MTEHNGIEGEWEKINFLKLKDGDTYRLNAKWNGPGPRDYSDIRIDFEDEFERFVPTPKHEIPTEPGFYEDVDGDIWHLSIYDEWTLSASGGIFETETEADVRPQEYLPFTKLKLTQE